MKIGDKPIPFTDPLVLAIMAGKKTVTRRPFKAGKAWVRMKQTVGPDHPMGINLAPGVQPCLIGNVYHAKLGDAGAVFARTRERNGILEAVETRKVWKPCWLGVKPGEFDWVSPWGAAGETMWVKEAWKVTGGEAGYDNGVTEGSIHDFAFGTAEVTYRAGGKQVFQELDENDDAQAARGAKPGWKPAMFLPRWASRIDLRLLEVGVQRLQDITEEEAKAEGLTFDGTYWLGSLHQIKGTPRCFPTAREAFMDVWRAIYGDDKPEANGWVWRLRFERVA